MNIDRFWFGDSGSMPGLTIKVAPPNRVLYLNLLFCFLVFFLIPSRGYSAYLSMTTSPNSARFDPLKDTVCTGENIQFRQDVSTWKQSTWRLSYENGTTENDLRYPFSCKFPGWVTLTHYLQHEDQLDSFSRSLYVAQTPDAVMPENMSLCEGEAVVFDFPPDEDLHVLWQDGSDEYKYIIDKTGNYRVQLSDQTRKCKIESNFFVKVLPMPSATLAPDYYICENETIWIEIKNLLHVKSIMWNNGSSYPDPEISAPGLYTATLSNGVCETQISTTVHPDDCSSCEFYFEKDLSPGFDQGWIWRTNCEEYYLLQGAIFNRHGNSVYIFDTMNPTPWDGFCGTEPCPGGIYIYYLDMEVMDERGEWKNERYNGSIELKD